ncbi:MAG: BrnT family toxin [Pseudomonadales bacterium]
MDFEWDDDKNRRNLAKHGIRFEEAALIFDGVTITRVDDRFDYGERRDISIGEIDSQIVIVVVHTDRDGVVRIISARFANRQERKVYYESREKVER